MSLLLRPVGALCIGALVAGVIGAQAQTPQFERELEEARNLYRMARFSDAILKLRELVEQLRPLGQVEARRIQLADAYLHLALSYVGVNETAAAKEAFLGALRIDSQRRLDPEVYAPKVVALFEEARAESRAERSTSLPPQRVQAEPKKKGSRLPWILVGVGAAAGGGVALAAGGNKSTQRADFSIRCEPSALSITTNGVMTTCAATSSNGFAGSVALSCSGQPAGVPCRFDPQTLSVLANSSLSSTMLVDLPFTAQPGSYTLQAVGNSGGQTRTADLTLSIATTCAGFREQASYTGSCANRPPNSICWGFSDGYIWFVENDGFGAPGYNLGPCAGRVVTVARGGRADYHHVLGTLFVKVGPLTR